MKRVIAFLRSAVRDRFERIDRQMYVEGDPVSVVMLQRPRAGAWALRTMLVALVTLIVWACLADLDIVVVGRGQIVSVESRVAVQSLTVASIRKIHVTVGQFVKQGDPLVALDPTFSHADLGIVKERLVAAQARLRRIETELRERVYTGSGTPQDVIQARYSEERRRHLNSLLRLHEEEAARLRAAIRTNDSHRGGLDGQHRILKEQEAMRSRLEEINFVSRGELLEFRRKRMEVETELERVTQVRQELSHERGKAEAARESVLREWQSNLRNEQVLAQREHDELLEQLNKAQRSAVLTVLSAPLDGVVLEVAHRNVGSVMKEGEPIVMIGPVTERLQAEVEISSSDIGMVRTGDRVRLKLDTLPFQKHGTLDAKISAITGDALESNDRGQRSLVYRARLDLDAAKFRNPPASFRLLPGMTLAAEVKVGTRRAISYFLYPLIRTFDESVREP